MTLRTSRMITMSSTSPNPPLGSAPQLRLCPQVGSDPTSIRIKITSKISPSVDITDLLGSMDENQNSSVVYQVMEHSRTDRSQRSSRHCSHREASITEQHNQRSNHGHYQAVEIEARKRSTSGSHAEQTADQG